MNSLQGIQQFAKTKEIIQKTNNAVIYTRVSSKEQAEGNASLATQLKFCNEYAKRKGYNVVEYFGGTYESAKSDERIQFKKMLSFLKRRSNISYIIVYSYDRFSRTGANAAYISSNLKRSGVHTISVSQEVDTSKPSGVFQENLYYIFSQFDNELRKDKSVTGMQEKLRNGYWCFPTPSGYTKKNKGATSDKAILELNEKGQMIKLAFGWILKKGWSIEEISKETERRGMPIKAKRLYEYLRNPFYAGLISSSLIPNEIYEGKHERAVSYKVFKEVNDILNGKKLSRKGFKNQETNNEVPLKGFLICDDCGSKMTGYKASKNKKYYYKCSKVGCCNNQRAEQVHDSFKEVLGYFQIDKKHIEPLKLMLKSTFSDLNKEIEISKKQYQSTLDSIETKLEKLEEKYIFEGISEDIYKKHLKKLSSEKEQILEEFENPLIKLSNLDKYIDLSLKMSHNLLNLWNKQDHHQKSNLQKILFPEGIRYNRKKEVYRTERVNSLFSLNNRFSERYKYKKQKGGTILNDSSGLVAGAGFEPTYAAADNEPNYL